MVETSARLLALLSLLQLRREWVGRDLADRLGVTERTIRRDVEKLRSLGYPVQAARGVAGGYRLRAGAELPPLLLDDEEAVAVALGLRTAVSGSISGIEETSMRALAKLEQVLPPRLRRRVSALGANTFAFGGPTDGARVDADQLAVIAGACRDRHRLRFGYTSRDGAATRRHTEPHSLVHSGWRWYLLAYDLDRADWRTFRVDRITGRLMTGARGARRTPPGGDPSAFVARAIRGGRDEATATIRLFAPADEMAERIHERHGTVEPLDDESCLFHARAPWHGGLPVYIAMLDVDFTVIDPPELADRVRDLAGRFARAG